MGAEERRTQLRMAVYGGDGEAVVALMCGGLGSADGLQLVGDGLMTALAKNIEGAGLLAGECAEALRARGWYGDDVLAGQLDALVGSRPVPMRRPLPVDLEELAGILEGDPMQGGGRVDLANGEVWHQAAIDYAREIGLEDDDESEDAERWLWVHCEGSGDGYSDMVAFIATVSDPGRADRLDIAIEGRGAFRRFKDVLGRWPNELARWYAFSDERQRGRARAWLSAAGYRVGPQPRRTPND